MRRESARLTRLGKRGGLRRRFRSDRSELERRANEIILAWQVSRFENPRMELGVTLAGYVAAALMGCTLGLIGGGGSILTVPILVYLFDVSPVTATSYSLFVVGLAGLVGAVRYLRRGQVSVATAIVFGVPSFAGVAVARVVLLPLIPDEIARIGPLVLTRDFVLMAAFAVFMVLAAVSMIRQRRGASQDGDARGVRGGLRWPLVALEGLVVGAVTGFLGAGGGFLIIPALVLVIGVSMKTAIGTSLLIIAIKSLFGFAVDLSVATPIDWGFLGRFSACALVGIFAGTSMNTYVSSTRLRRGFGWLALCAGSLILVTELSRQID